MRKSVYSCDLCEGPITRGEPDPNASTVRAREEWDSPDVMLGIISGGDMCIRIHACTACLRAFVKGIKAKHIRVSPELSAYDPHPASRGLG